MTVVINLVIRLYRARDIGDYYSNSFGWDLFLCVETEIFKNHVIAYGK